MILSFCLKKKNNKSLIKWRALLSYISNMFPFFFYEMRSFKKNKLRFKDKDIETPWSDYNKQIKKCNFFLLSIWVLVRIYFFSAFCLLKNEIELLLLILSMIDLLILKKRHGLRFGKWEFLLYATIVRLLWWGTT